MSRTRTLAFITLILLPLLYFYPAVGGQVVLMPGDGWTQIYGLRVLIGQLLAQGEWPLWNPYIFGGMPLLASIQVGALFPLTWAFAFLPPFVAMNVMVILTYHLALLGTYGYARSIGMTRLAALLTGVSFTFGSFMLCHLGHTNRIAAAAWLPWILWALEQLYQQAQWRWVIAGALFIALQLFAGDPQMTAYTVLLGAPYWLFAVLLRERQQSLLKTVSYTAAMGIGGFLLSAIQLLPDREMLRYGERAQISYEYFSLYSLPPRQLFGMVFPYFFGGASTQPYSIPYWGEWNYPETSLYVGLLPLLLLAIALRSERKNRLVWFWSGAALLTLGLSLGAHLPFEANRLLYKIPLYNLFRAQGRHTLECTFALAVLGGLGLTRFVALPLEQRRQMFWWGAAVLLLLVTMTGVAYVFFGPALALNAARPPQAGRLTNWEFLLPVGNALLAILGLWIYTRVRNQWSAAVLFLILLLDLATFGQCFEWKTVAADRLQAQTSDAPTVTFLKQREQDWNTFRFAARAPHPYRDAYALLNYPNGSIERGLQSINGYDPLFLTRTAAIVGAMDLEGIPQEKNVYDGKHRGLDLLNVKYLLNENHPPAAEAPLRYEGIAFAATPLSLDTAAGTHYEFSPETKPASELAVISTLANAVDVPDETPILRFKIHTATGQIIEQKLRAGRDTAEWTHDRVEVKARIRHRRAPVAESWEVTDYQGHRYLARLKFARAEITRIEVDHVSPVGNCVLYRLSLFDAVTQTAQPLASVGLPTERWNKLATFGTVDVYENVRHLPRAWLVNELVVQPSQTVLQTIKTGMLDTRQPFDPRQTALLTGEDFGGQPYTLPTFGALTNPHVRVTAYRPNALQLETDNAAAAFLVLSEIYFRGWEAEVDGIPTPIYRVNHTLRGIALSGGNHRVAFHYRPQSFYNGRRLTVGGIVFLLLGAVISRFYRRRPLRPLAV